MAKITKHAEFMDTLRGMVVPSTAGVSKEAQNPTATGKPGADTHFTSISDKHDTINKNEEGKPENNPQEFKQEKAKDPSDPTKKHAEEEAAKLAADKEAQAIKSTLPATGKPDEAAAAPNEVKQKKAEADETTNTKLAELGAQLIAAIEASQKASGQQKQAEGPTATGKPGADTHFTSISDKHDKVNKNEEGKPESNPQEFKQEKAKDPSDPTKKHATVTDIEKDASFELGRQFTRAFLTQFVQEKQASVYKEAGRRDFETLIAQAAAELEQQAEPEKQAQVLYDETYAQEKQAEEAGAQAFYTLLKQAQEEQQQEQVKAAFEQRYQQLALEKDAAEKKASELAAKLAEREAAIEKKAADEKRAEEFAAWSNHTVNTLLEKLKVTSARD